MKSESKLRSLRLPWHESAELLLESVPGVISATIEGEQHSVSEVRVWYEPTWPVGQVIDAVRECLSKEANASLTAARFHAVVAEPDRRAQRRALLGRVPTTPDERGGSLDAPLRLLGHKVEEVRHGVVGAEVWIEWQGRTFSGAAIGPSAPPGNLRTPALATLRALHSCLQILYNGPVHPGLVLESVVQIMVENSPIVVVTLTASEHARPHTLTSAWAVQGASGLAVILATLHATSRTVTRWLNEEQPSDGDRRAITAGSEGAQSDNATSRRLTLVDFEVDRSPSGDLDVGVRLTGFGEAVDRSRNGSDNEAAHLELGASATLDGVHELLQIGGWSERHDRDLRHAGTSRLRTGEHDIVVVLAEALMDGRWVPLAGAASADSGVERASITAALQATNALVADRTATKMPTASADEVTSSIQTLK